MSKIILLFACILLTINSYVAQNAGILRKNYFSSYFDSTLNATIDVFDSSTIRLGSVEPLTGVVSPIGNQVYNMAINLNGATNDYYQNRYYIGSGFNLLSFDMGSGDLINNVPITGPLPSSSFQNFRFNPSDSMIYGMVPNNFYSTYFDSLSMTYIDVLDSTQIRFGSIDPVSGQYTIIGNQSFQNLYTLAGNSIDPYQMVYYYSAVDSLIGIDLYNGTIYTEVPIQMQPYGLFENIAYSCVDTCIYGLSRQNYTSMVYDSLFMDFVEVIDSTTFRLSKINPNTGVVSFVSPCNIQAGGNLTGGAYIDPNTMTYYFNNGNYIVGVSLNSGLITSSVLKSYPSGEIALDMMRSNLNCYGASKVRTNPSMGIPDTSSTQVTLSPNPTQDHISIKSSGKVKSIYLLDMLGHQIMSSSNETLDLSSQPAGMYLVHILVENGALVHKSVVKN